MKKDDLYFKVITGYGKDQYHQVHVDDLHKIYYLWLNPEKRGILTDGTPIIGKNIIDILPDYNKILGHAPTIILDSYDWQKINNTSLRDRIEIAKTVASKLAVKINAFPEINGMRMIEAARQYENDFLTYRGIVPKLENFTKQ